jgi:hypothetical protein
MSKNGELRFGTHGSMAVDLKKGIWFDHEAGKGGGPLDLIMLKTGLTTAREAYTWAEQHGLWHHGNGRGGRQLHKTVRDRPAKPDLSSSASSSGAPTAAARTKRSARSGRTETADGYTALTASIRPSLTGCPSS